VEEAKKQHESSEVVLSENIYDAADAFDGFIQQRKSGKVDNWLFSVMRSEASERKEGKKNEIKKWISKEPGIPPVFEKAASLAAGMLQEADDSSLSEIDWNDGRYAKKASSGKDKAKQQTESGDDFDDLTQSSEAALEDCKLPSCNYRNFMSLIEEHGVKCKGGENQGGLQEGQAVRAQVGRRVLEAQGAGSTRAKQERARMSVCVRGSRGWSRQASQDSSHSWAAFQQTLERWLWALGGVEGTARKRETPTRASQTNDCLSHQANSVSLWKIQDAVLSYERFIELKKNHCELLTGNIKAMKVKVSELQKELSKTKETQSQIEHQKMEWKRECCNLRETLKQEETKRKHADMVQKKIKEQLGEKKEQLYKEVEEKQQLELKLRALDMELRTVRNNLEQVSGSDEREKDLLRRNHILRDEIVTLKQEIDKIKNQKQEKEKEYFDDIEIMKEKNHELRKMMRLNKKTLTETIFLHNQELNDLKAEVTTLSSKLENEKQNKERLETEVEACGSKLAVTLHEHDQTQAAKRDLELAFQKAKEEWLHLQEKMNFDVADLKANNEILSQKLARSENQFTSLETKLHHMREALREQTSDLKDAWRDLSYAQSQKKEVELMYVQEQSKVKEYVEKQASLEDRLSQLQSENVLLRERLDHARDMIAECSRLKESVCRYENEKAAREVVVKQLQQELVDTMKKQSMAETSLELTSCCQINLEDEIQYVKTLSQFRSQGCQQQQKQKLKLRRSSSSGGNSSRGPERVKIHGGLGDLPASWPPPLCWPVSLSLSSLLMLFCWHPRPYMARVSAQVCPLAHAHTLLEVPTLRTCAGPRVSIITPMMDDLTAKPEPATSTWPHLDAENQFRQQELSVKATPNKYERLEKKKKKQKQVVVSWRSPMETNLVERCQDERDMRVIERTVQDIEEKVNKVSSLLQTQATSQNHLEQLIESHNTSVRSQMELSCKVLETELFKMKTEKNSNNIELEKYKHLYLEEVKSRECLENELSRMNKKLTEVSSKYMERMHNRCLLSTVATMPAPGLPGVTDLSHHLLPCIYPTAGQSSTAFPTSKAEPLNDGKGSYYNKMKQEFDRAVTKELREAVAEYEIESCTSSFVPTDEFKLRQDPVLKASEEYVWPTAALGVGKGQVARRVPFETAQQRTPAARELEWSTQLAARKRCSGMLEAAKGKAERWGIGFEMSLKPPGSAGRAKVFSLKSRKGWWFWGSSINPQPHIAGVKSANSRQLGYSDIQDEDLGKTHKAAVAGDVARVQEILLLGKSGLNFNIHFQALPSRTLKTSTCAQRLPTLELSPQVAQGPQMT
ncbi:Ankyrin repeat domain-containing protein 26, partial [Galemys pyrenaicus]